MVRWRAIAVILLLAASTTACGATNDGETPSQTSTSVSTHDPTSDPTPACSAEGMSVSASDEGLPEPVAMTRDRIIELAVGCDLEGLAGLGGAGFTYSFGGKGDPATFWREAEEAGEPVLATLVAVLEQPAAMLDADWVWPRAASGEGAPADVQALADAVGHDPEQWFLDGDYVGPRVGIGSDGSWSFYVTGD
ncbi:MAG: hypothetical protein WD096_06190 [Actinomycetota bacterium]